jgi:hypothetical protein
MPVNAAEACPMKTIWGKRWNAEDESSAATANQIAVTLKAGPPARWDRGLSREDMRI